MRYVVILIILATIPTTLFAREPIIEGEWFHGGVTRMADFVIEDSAISFLESKCERIPIEIIEKFDGNIVHWDNSSEYGKAKDFVTYVIKINYPGDSSDCRINNIRAQFIRMTIPKINRCYSSTYFYKNIDKLNADKAKEWNGNYTSGWAGLIKTKCH